MLFTNHYTYFKMKGGLLMIMDGSKENTVTKADEKFNTPITALDQHKSMLENSNAAGVPIMEDGFKHFEGDVFAEIPITEEQADRFKDFEGDVLARIPVGCGVDTRINIQPPIEDVPIVAVKNSIDWDRPVSIDTCSKPPHSNFYGVEVFTPHRVESIVDDYTSREECKYSVIKKQIEQEDPTMDTQFDRTKVKKEIHNCIAKILCLKSTYSLSDSTIEDIVVDVLEKMENNEEVLV